MNNLLLVLESDPHGIIITLVSVTVVFTALIILYFAYSLIGRLSSGRKTVAAPAPEEAAAIALALDQELNGEVYAAIGMAMHQYLNDTVHDMESYIITIKRKQP